MRSVHNHTLSENHGQPARSVLLRNLSLISSTQLVTNLYFFSYEKLFGVKLKTETDIKNEREGKDNSITRTTRLFYVACTRAQKS